MRVKRHGWMVFILGLSLFGCANYPDGDMHIEAKIINTWTSNGLLVVQVEGKGWRMDFSKMYTPALRDLTIGDCVKVWVRQYKSGTQIPYGNRDLTPCDKK